MSVYAIYIFDRHCRCIFHQNWQKQLQPTKDEAPSWEEDAKLVFGVLFSLNNMIEKLATRHPHEGLQTFKTSTYKFHYLPIASGLKFILMTDPQVDKMNHILFEIYSSIYLEFVIKNPLIYLDKEEQERNPTWLMENEVFKSRLFEYLKKSQLVQ